MGMIEELLSVGGLYASPITIRDLEDTIATGTRRRELLAAMVAHAEDQGIRSGAHHDALARCEAELRFAARRLEERNARVAQLRVKIPTFWDTIVESVDVLLHGGRR